MTQRPRWMTHTVLFTSALYCATASAQTLNEHEKLQPSDLQANHHFGQTAAIGGGNPFTEPVVVLVGAPGTGGGAYSFIPTVNGYGNIGTFDWTSPHSPVAASTATNVNEGIFGYVHDLDGPSVHQLRPTTAQWTSGMPAAPESLDLQFRVFVAGASEWAGDSGRVDTYRYDVPTDTWLPEDPLFPSEFFVEFGAAVAIHPDGNLLAVGAPAAGLNGEVTVFVANGTGWSAFQTLQPPAEWNTQSGARFGDAVSFHGDWIAVGAPLYDNPAVIGGTALDAGAVLLYSPDGVGFYEQRQFLRKRGTSDRMGTSVDLAESFSGSLLLAVGIPGEDAGAVDTGAAEVYRLEGGGTWRLVEQLVASDGASGDELGTAVSIWRDVVLAGAPFANRGSGPVQFGNAGAAYLFYDINRSEIFTDGFESGDTSAWN